MKKKGKDIATLAFIVSHFKQAIYEIKIAERLGAPVDNETIVSLKGYLEFYQNELNKKKEETNA